MLCTQTLFNTLFIVKSQRFWCNRPISQLPIWWHRSLTLWLITNMTVFTKWSCNSSVAIQFNSIVDFFDWLNRLAWNAWFILIWSLCVLFLLIVRHECVCVYAVGRMEFMISSCESLAWHGNKYRHQYRRMFKVKDNLSKYRHRFYWAFYNGGHL